MVRPGRSASSSASTNDPPTKFVDTFTLANRTCTGEETMRILRYTGEDLCAKTLYRAGLLFLIFEVSSFTSYAQIITTYVGPPLPVSGQPAVTQAIDYPVSV